MKNIKYKFIQSIQNNKSVIKKNSVKKAITNANRLICFADAASNQRIKNANYYGNR